MPGLHRLGTEWTGTCTIFSWQQKMDFYDTFLAAKCSAMLNTTASCKNGMQVALSGLRHKWLQQTDAHTIPSQSDTRRVCPRSSSTTKSSECYDRNIRMLISSFVDRGELVSAFHSHLISGASQRSTPPKHVESLLKSLSHDHHTLRNGARC